MTVPKKETLGRLLRKAHVDYLTDTTSSRDMFDYLQLGIRKWLHQFLDEMPEGEFGEKSMLLVLS